ncbi:MAG: hypothetical protein LBC09_01010 [Helicobacteraceae bacterium]|jgi:hypothetical protein|nr:hypothetical protein [Helicobacteraceae bacterium]
MAEALLSGVIERDLNPFFLFDARGKAIYLNQAAELLLGYANPNIFFMLAKRAAAMNGSFAMRFETMSFQSFNFYGLMAGEEGGLVGLRLYHIPVAAAKIGYAEMTAANLRAITDANIALFRHRSKIAVRTACDRALPPVGVSQNGFSRLLGKALDSFGSSDEPLLVALRAPIGLSYDGGAARNRSHIKLIIAGAKRKTIFDAQITEFADALRVFVKLAPDEIVMDIPIAA